MRSPRRPWRWTDEEPAGYFALCAANIWSRDLEKAEAMAKRAEELAPNSADIHRMKAQFQLSSAIRPPPSSISTPM